MAGRVGLYFELLDHNARGEEVVEFLKGVHRRVGRLTTVWDRNQIHSKARAVKAWLAERPDVVAEDFPGYGPDLNPDGGVWSWTKYGQLANLAANDKQELWDWVPEELITAKHRPDLLRGFIQQTQLPGLTLAARVTALRTPDVIGTSVYTVIVTEEARCPRCRSRPSSTSCPTPRRATANKRHALTDILSIATCAVIAGAESWEAIAEYGRTKADFFRRFLVLENGIPSADTFERVFAKLAPRAFARAFGRWMALACQATGLTPIAIDGKSARSAPKNTATGCLHLVSAWATENRLTLGQVAVPDGSNEIAAIPELLKVLDLSGAIVTIDAAGCQVANAQEIRRQGGHYLLPAKGNQPTLQEAVEAVFARADTAGFEGVRFDHHATSEDGHGRHEERSVSVIYEPAGLPPSWPDVAAVISVLRERSVGEAVTTTTHFYLTSHAGTAAEIAGLIRGHWGIESMHWVLDVAFREVDSRVRAGHAGENLALIRRVAVSLLRRAPGKGSTPTKRLKARGNDEYMLQVLQGIQASKVR